MILSLSLSLFLSLERAIEKRRIAGSIFTVTKASWQIGYGLDADADVVVVVVVVVVVAAYEDNDNNVLQLI